MSQQVEAVLEIAAREGSRKTGFMVYWRRFRQDKRAVFGLAIIIAFSICAAFAGLITPYDAAAQDFELLEGPTIGHPLGTDNIGRDLLSRLMVGARTSMIVAIFGLTFAAIVGIPLGIVSGFYGGWVDMIVMRYIDIQWAFPNFIIAVMLVGIFGLGVQNVVMAIFLAYIDDFARVVRAMVLAIKEEDYIIAARGIGVGDVRMMVRHIFPNAMPPVIVLASVFFASAILIEAGLTFLGLGVSPLTPTWGTVLNDARPFFTNAWWLGTFPGLTIMFVVLAVNFVGDAVRDLNDVREYSGLATGV